MVRMLFKKKSMGFENVGVTNRSDTRLDVFLKPFRTVWEFSSQFLVGCMQGQCWNSGITLPLNQFDGLAIEGELAITLNQPINEIIDQELELSGVIQAVFPVIELHTYPFERPPTAAEMIARNAIHAGFVYDKNTECSSQFPDQITIKIDEIEVACVSGAVNYETVLHSLRWLAMTLKKKGLKTSANQIVLCGSAAPLFPLRQGGYIEVSTDTDIKVECSIKP